MSSVLMNPSNRLDGWLASVHSFVTKKPSDFWTDFDFDFDFDTAMQDHSSPWYPLPPSRPPGHPGGRNLPGPNRVQFRNIVFDRTWRYCRYPPRCSTQSEIASDHCLTLRAVLRSLPSKSKSKSKSGQGIRAGAALQKMFLRLPWRPRRGSVGSLPFNHDGWAAVC